MELVLNLLNPIQVRWTDEDEDRVQDPTSKESWDEQNGNYDDDDDDDDD